MVHKEASQPQVLGLRVDFFPNPSRLSVHRDLTRLAQVPKVAASELSQRTARYYVQCNCACK